MEYHVPAERELRRESGFSIPVLSTAHVVASKDFYIQREHRSADWFELMLIQVLIRNLSLERKRNSFILTYLKKSWRLFFIVPHLLENWSKGVQFNHSISKEQG